MTDAEKVAKAEEILNRMQVKGWEKYHVIGCFERRVTIYSQQVRALNLIWALSVRGNLTNKSKIAVIGGGIAGLTAAAAARHLGCHVTILEKESGFLLMQEGATHRPIHPFIYDWPNEGSLEKNAGLPLLNWEAANADEVVKQMAKAWQGFADSKNDHVNINDLHLLASGEVHWNASGHKKQKFDHVIVAVGFGVEKYEKVARKRYWTSENLHQAGQHEEPAKFVISGCGDGGVIDVLRIRLLQFDLVALIKKLKNADGYADLCTKIRAIEDGVPWSEGEKGVASYYDDHYPTLEVSPAIENLITFKDHTEVHLCYNQAGPYSPRASTLNRFLLSRIISKDRNTRTKQVTLKEEIIESIDHKYKINDSRFKDRNGRPILFDDIIIRHGPAPAIGELTSDFFIAAQRLNSPQRIARTPQKSWSEGFFGPEPVPIQKPGHSEPPPRPKLPALTPEALALFRALLVMSDERLPSPLLDSKAKERAELVKQSLLVTAHGETLRLVPHFATLGRSQLNNSEDLNAAVENACGLLWPVYSKSKIDLGNYDTQFPTVPSKQLERYSDDCTDHVLAIGKQNLFSPKEILAKFVTKFLHTAGNRMLRGGSKRACEVLECAHRWATTQGFEYRRICITYDIAEARYQSSGKSEEVRKLWVAVAHDFEGWKPNPLTPWYLANTHLRIGQIEHAFGQNEKASEYGRTALQFAHEAMENPQIRSDMTNVLDDLKAFFDKLGEPDCSATVRALRDHKR